MPASDPSTQRIRLFESERLEKLTLISPRTFAVGWAVMLPSIAWAGWGSVNPNNGLCLFAGGLLVWTLFEYVMHRCLFHLNVDQPAMKWFVYVIHGNHHDSPNDSKRSLMPFLVSLPIAALGWGFCVALLGAAGTWLFLGWITGYVIYDAVHYACHQWAMGGKLGSALKRHHMRHHYIDERGNFAISAIIWDWVFGSKIKSVKGSDRTASLDAIP
jgi:sterol desaturase/sphingolipid hydroxylase (fatty acid hydroxylase superfamily)